LISVKCFSLLIDDRVLSSMGTPLHRDRARGRHPGGVRRDAFGPSTGPRLSNSTVSMLSRGGAEGLVPCGRLLIIDLLASSSAPALGTTARRRGSRHAAFRATCGRLPHAKSLPRRGDRHLATEPMARYARAAFSNLGVGGSNPSERAST
jgi:hypothetical protein